MAKPNVYLAGPITGLSYNGCVDWRESVKAKFEDMGITGLSPMRHKDYLLNETTIADTHADLSVMSSQRGIFARDEWDVRRCDIVLVNMLGAERVSIGTVMEIAWAWAYKVPVVLVMESQGNIHEHSMLREACPFRVDTLDEAVDIIGAMLTP